MKTSLLLVLFLVLAQLLSAQNTKAPDSIIPAKGNTDKQLEKIIETKTARHSDSLGNEPKRAHSSILPSRINTGICLTMTLHTI